MQARRGSAALSRGERYSSLYLRSADDGCFLLAVERESDVNISEAPFQARAYPLRRFDCDSAGSRYAGAVNGNRRNVGTRTELQI